MGTQLASCHGWGGSGRRAGLTLIELVLVLAIVVVLGAMAVPRYSEAMHRYQIHTAGHRIQADLELARAHARQRSEAVTVQFHVEADRLTIGALPDRRDPGMAYRTELDRRPYHAKLIEADFEGETELTFDGYGRTQTAGRLVLESGSRQRVIHVRAPDGRVSIDD